MTPEDKTLMIEELATLDKKEQADLIVGVESGESYEIVFQTVREKYRAEFFQIVQKYNPPPIFRSPFPAPHAPTHVS